jgi:hypothetical protein
MNMKYEQVLEKFIDANLDKLSQEFFEHCYFGNNSDGPSYISRDGEILNDKVFSEWVEQEYATVITAIEDILREEEKSLAQSSREYANQVMADYKFAQTGKY